jgi:hypothetical protein
LETSAPMVEATPARVEATMASFSIHRRVGWRRRDDLISPLYFFLGKP